MRLNPRQGPARVAGFSLVELMIAITIGLIIIGAVTLFTVRTMQAYSDHILSTRLTQELRTGMNLVVRELRRSGHDSTSVTRVLTTSSASSFDAMDVVASCVTYEYDRQVGAAGPDGTEIRGVRLSDGVLQINATGGGVDCAAEDGWEDITDPGVVQITKFEPTIYESEFCSQLSEDTDPATGTTTYDMARGSVRTITLCLQGEMVSGDAIRRHVTDSVRIRAENLVFENDVASNACAPGAEAVPTPEVLNAECAK